MPRINMGACKVRDRRRRLSWRRPERVKTKTEMVVPITTACGLLGEGDRLSLSTMAGLRSA